MIEQGYSYRTLVRIFNSEGYVSPEVRPGQFLDVMARNSNGQEMMVPITVLVIYPNRDYVGEVVWTMA